jgi:hypothetical protein
MANTQETIDNLSYSEACAILRVNPDRAMRLPDWTPGQIMRLATPKELRDRPAADHHAWLIENGSGGSLRGANLTSGEILSTRWQVQCTTVELAEARRQKDASDQKAIDDRSEAQNAINEAQNPDPSKQRRK